MEYNVYCVYIYSIVGGGHVETWIHKSFSATCIERGRYRNSIECKHTEVCLHTRNNCPTGKNISRQYENHHYRQKIFVTVGPQVWALSRLRGTISTLFLFIYFPANGPNTSSCCYGCGRTSLLNGCSRQEI